MALPTPIDSTPSLIFGRFQLVEELGAGSQGRVVRAFDLATRREVALKLLSMQGAEALQRFKNEFRILAGLVHPNLVRLGELFAHDQHWGFSMELVRGGDFTSWVRGDEGCDEANLREGLRQVGSALVAVHQAGLIHRDIKPENVRVTPNGRVVVVDFGLATAHGPSARTTQHRLVGTASYMAPELMAGELATDKSDLYALGVMLYQALTGMLPFGEGDPYQVATMQRMVALLPPLAPDLPEDLEALCVALLAREPAQRPSARELLERLSAGSTRISGVVTLEPRADAFVGRECELAALRELVHGSGLRCALVRGESGVGKSALVEQLIRDARRELPELVVLAGRCHASEHVSYNAFDDIVDDLSRLLSILPVWKRDLVLPRSAHLLPSLFPTLASIPNLTISEHDVHGPELDRAQLFAAFTALLLALGERFPLLLAIDDLQWADADSLQLLRSVLERAPALTLIMTARSESHEPAAYAALLSDARVQTLALAPLEPRDARALGARLLGTRLDSERVAALVVEAGGSPIFLIELARAPAARATTLDAALLARVRLLPAAAQRVLELVSSAAAPLSTGVLIAALETTVEELYGSVAVLRRDRLLREDASGQLVAYHDRIREAVLESLSAETRIESHRALASTFELAPFRHALRAAQHWLLAGEPTRAAPRLEEAAAQAYQSAVFEQAAELYRSRLGLDGAPLTASARRALQIRLADALESAGNYSQSAHTLLAAVEGASLEQRRDLSLRAAQQLLQAGELAPGRSAAARALREVELPWSASALASLVQIGVHRLKIRAARAGLARHTGSHAVVARQLDTLVRLIHPLAWSDSLRSMELSSRALLLALSADQREHLPTLLAAEAVQVSMRDPGSAQAELLLDEAQRYLPREGQPAQRTYCRWARGATAVANTRYREATAQLREAERGYRQECPGEAWMHVNTRGMLLNAWIGGGAHREFVEHGERWIREAQTRGDLYAHAYYAVGGQAAFRHVMDDAPEHALREIDSVMQPWQHSWGLHALLRTKLTHDVLSYVDGERAHAWWEQTGRVTPLTPAFFADGFAWRRAEAALRAGLARGSLDLVRSAQRQLTPLARARTLYVRVFAGMTRMQIALLLGRWQEGLALAEVIGHELSQQDDYRTRSYALLRAALEQARPPQPAHWEPLRHWFLEQGWKNPQRALRWLLPVAGHAGADLR